MTEQPYFYTLTTTAAGTSGVVGWWSESSGRSGPTIYPVVEPIDQGDTDLLLDSLPSRYRLATVPFYHLSTGSPPRRSVDRVGSVYRSGATGAVILEEGGRWYVARPTPSHTFPACLLPVPGVPRIGAGAGVRLPAALWSSLSGGQ